jgi:putative transposase
MMTDSVRAAEVAATLVGVNPATSGEEPEKTLELSQADKEVIAELVRAARASGSALTGPDGLLKELTKMVVETALDEEMSEHLGYDKHAPEGRNRGNSRNGKRSKTVITDNAGPVPVEVPRDRDGTFEPVIVPKRARRLSDLDAVVLSLSAKGLTTGEISAHFQEIYGASVSKDTVTRITDRVLEEMASWWARPLETVYAAVFIDAIMVKVRDGQVRNRPFYAAIGVDLAGHKDVLGLWAGDGDGESAKFWYAVVNDLKSRGVKDIFFTVCDGLKGLPDAVNSVFPATIVQTCIIHLIRGSFRYASAKYRDELAKDLKLIYQAVNADAAAAALDTLEDKWGSRYPAVIRLWRTAWTEFVPFLDYNLEIRRVLCSTNAIESLNARFRRAIRARGHFPNEQSAMKTLYLVVRSLDPTGTGQQRWAQRWKPALNAFAITFADRMPAAENQ